MVPGFAFEFRNHFSMRYVNNRIKFKILYLQNRLIYYFSEFKERYYAC